MIKILGFLTIFFLYNTSAITMEKKPYHHLPDGTFRNPEGSPVRSKDVKFSYRQFSKEKKKIDLTIPEDLVVDKETVLSDLRKYENEDLASVILKYDSGVISTMTVSDSIVSPWSWEMNSGENSDFPLIKQNCYLIGGSKGSLSIPDLKIWHHEGSEDWTKPLKIKKLDYEINDPLVDQIKHFKEIIESNVEPIVSDEEGFKSLKVIDAIEQSIKTKKNVNI